jgi:predicted ATPase/class 3 adenylate cyclase/Flp pilus assembly protein TadD
VLICPSCRRESEERFTFCPHCGAALPAAKPVAETRKTVTMLFCDVTGSTGLGEGIDPESLRKVMGRYFDMARTCLERHGGTVEKFIGDAVMAVFGIPQQHEDDALRACRAAAEIRDGVAELGSDVKRDFGASLEVRIGVNTGEVVAGDPAAGQAMVTGDAVNVAARLEQIAPPGEILIGRSTYELVRDAVVAEPTEPLGLKGKSGTVPAFRLAEVHPTAPAFARRLDSQLVGREGELRLLRQAFERAGLERVCHQVTVFGPAGVGKSRLVEEFLGDLAGARVLRGRCLPYGEGITFYPVVEVLKQAAGIADFEDPGEAERKVCTLVESEEHGALICARIGQLLGLADGNAMPEETLWAIRRFLEVLAQDRPLVVVFDDIHWGEATFLDLIEHVADWTRDAPILLVCMARPEHIEVRPGWTGGKRNATSTLLDPLPAEQCERLLDNLLGNAEVAEEVQSQILEAAEGNPLFVEQMVSMLMDDGLLVRDDGRWVATADLSEVPVPPTIAALLAARLDRLSAEERAVIQRASVVGKVFYLGAVAALSSGAERPSVAGHVTSLVRKELVRPDRTTLPGEDAVRFGHQLIRDAAYESTPKEVRAELHERFADWLEAVAGERIEEQEEILGYHLEQAGRYRAQLGSIDERVRELGRRAAMHLTAAGRRASARGDMGAAANLLWRAAELLPRADRDRLALLPELGSALSEAGRYDQASAILKEAIDQAQGIGDRLTEAHARATEVVLRVEAEPEGQGEEAARVADELIPVFEAAGDDLGLARAYRLRSTSSWEATRYSEMAADAERAVEHARRAGDPTEQGLAEHTLVAAYTWGPVPVAEAIRKFAELKREGVSGRTGEVDLGTGIMLAMAGRFDESRRLLEQARAVADDLGRPAWAGAILQDWGIAELIAGDAPEAERILREGREVLLRIGEKGHLSSLSANLAVALCIQGRFDEAEPFIEESREFAATGDVASQGGWRQAMAMVLANRGDLGEADRLAREAVDLAKGGDGIDDQGEALSGLAQVLVAAGRSEEAVVMLQEAIEKFDQKGNVVSASRARERLTVISPET